METFKVITMNEFRVFQNTISEYGGWYEETSKQIEEFLDKYVPDYCEYWYSVLDREIRYTTIPE